MKDLIITINTNTRKAKTTKNFIGINGENLQGNIIFDFENEFIDGVGFLEVDNGDKYIIEMEKEAEAEYYTIPIKSSLLTKTCILKVQLRVDNQIDEETVTVFKSQIIEIPVLSAVNATATIPDEYPSWLEEATVAVNACENATTRANTISADLEEKVETDYYRGVGVADTTVDQYGKLKMTYTDGQESEAGYVFYTIGLNGSSGTLSADNLKLAKQPTTVINRMQDNYYLRYAGQNNLLTKTYYKGQNITAGGDLIQGQIEIDNTTGAWTYSSTTIEYEVDAEARILSISGDTPVTAGKVLMADGNGYATWEDAGGAGTTLNKYTYTITNNSTGRTNFMNIMRNAKGRINGNVQLEIYDSVGTAHNLTFPVGAFYTDGGGQLLVNGITYESNNYWLINGNLGSNAGTSSSNNCSIDFANGTIHVAVNNAKVIGGSIIYYNDTQLH